MASDWYYAKGKQKVGPVDATELKRLAATSILMPEDLVWKQGQPKWLQASSVKGLFPDTSSRATGTAAPTPTPTVAVALPAITATEAQQKSMPPSVATKKATFLQWYRHKFGNQWIVVQGLLWLFYGFIWIPMLWLFTRHTVTSEQNPVSDPLMRVPQAKAEPSARARTVDEIIADADAKRKAYARGLTVRFPYSRVWTPRNQKAVEIGLCEILFAGVPPTQGFFSVGDKPQEVVIESSDTQVIAPTRDPKHTVGPYFIAFGKPGKATITVRVGDYKVSHEMEVVMAPVAPGDQTDFVIREMGLPTHKTNVFVEWPNLERHDCFLYNPRPTKPFIGEHWWFEKSQDLILSIANGEVHYLGTNRKSTTNQIELRAEVPDPN